MQITRVRPAADQVPPEMSRLIVSFPILPVGSSFLPPLTNGPDAAAARAWIGPPDRCRSRNRQRPSDKPAAIHPLIIQSATGTCAGTHSFHKLRPSR